MRYSRVIFLTGIAGGLHSYNIACRSSNLHKNLNTFFMSNEEEYRSRKAPFSSNPSRTFLPSATVSRVALICRDCYQFGYVFENVIFPETVSGSLAFGRSFDDWQRAIDCTLHLPRETIGAHTSGNKSDVYTPSRPMLFRHRQSPARYRCLFDRELCRSRARDLAYKMRWPQDIPSSITRD